MTTDELAARRELATETILEDESLTSDLADDAARALIDWAIAEVSKLATDPAVSDETVTAYGRSVRSAIRAAAADSSADEEGIVAQARKHLASHTRALLPQASTPVTTPDTPPAPSSALQANSAATALTPRPVRWVGFWCVWRRRGR